MLVEHDQPTSPITHAGHFAVTGINLAKPLRLVAFTGLKGSGKDTAAEVFVEKGWTHVKFADALKSMLDHLLELAGLDYELRSRMIDGDLKETPHDALAGRTPRHAMQTLGEAWGRLSMAPDFWVSMIELRIRGLDRVVISDVRYPNEAALVAKLGGQTWRIDRGILPMDTHSSETNVPGLAVNGTITNDYPDASRFKAAVAYVFDGALP